MLKTRREPRPYTGSLVPTQPLYKALTRAWCMGLSLPTKARPPMPSRHTSRHTLSPTTKLGSSYLQNSHHLGGGRGLLAPSCSCSEHRTVTPKWGGLWEQHLKVVLRSMGGEEIQEYPGNFWFPAQRLLLSTYVDDLTLSGPQEEHQAFGRNSRPWST